MKVAIMGYGTIGSGVAEILEVNRDVVAKRCGEPLELKYVLDLRDFEGDPIADKIVHDYKTIVEDPEVAIVVETMGGVEPAYTFVKAMLEAGKHVTTSNKALVADKGAELIEIARNHKVNFLFEASVGGGIPIIRPLTSCLTGDVIEGISHITATDIKYANKMGRAIKLLATSKKVGDSYVARVAPFLISPEHPLYNVHDVFNAIFVHGNMLGDGMFYGSGAGKLPTASAVVGDMVAIAKHIDKNIYLEWEKEKLVLADPNEQVNRFFVRSAASEAEIENIFGQVEFVESGLDDEIGFVTEAMKESDYATKAAALGEVRQMIRLV